MKYLQTKKSKQKVKHDSQLKSLEDFKVGDYVFLKTSTHKDNQTNNRAGQIYKSGPFKILNRTRDNVILCDFRGNVAKNKFSIHNIENCGPLPDDSFKFDEFLNACRVKLKQPRMKHGKLMYLYYPMSPEGRPMKHSGFWA